MLQHGFTPLHNLCTRNDRNNKEDMLFALLDANKDVHSIHSQYYRANHDKLPLHHLCLVDASEQAVSISMVQRCFDAYPEAIQHQDGSGNTPLDYLTSNMDKLEQDHLAKLKPGDFQQFCFQLFAQNNQLEFCRYLVEKNGADADEGYRLDIRSPRAIGMNSVRPDVREYFKSVQRFLGRFKLSKRARHISETCCAISAKEIHQVCLLLSSTSINL